MKNLIVYPACLLVFLFSCETNKTPLVSSEPAEVWTADSSLYDHEFAKGQFYFVDENYRDAFESSLDTGLMALEIDPAKALTRLDVWISTFTPGPYYDAIPAIAGINPDTLTATTEEIPGEIEAGRFLRLIENINYSYNPQRGYFRLHITLGSNQILAVAYETAGGEKVGTYWADLDSTALHTTKCFLNLVKPKTLVPDYPTWDLTMRNVYFLGNANRQIDSLDVRISYWPAGDKGYSDPQSGYSYNFLLGLDRLDPHGAYIKGGDGKIDKNLPFIFTPEHYLIFLSLTPFDPSGIFNFDPNRHVEMYETNDPTVLMQESKFKIEVKYYPG